MRPGRSSSVRARPGWLPDAAQALTALAVNSTTSLIAGLTLGALVATFAHDSREALVGSFCALLELVRLEVVEVAQEGPRADIEVRVRSERLAELEDVVRNTRFDEELGTDEGWARYNRHSWLRDYAGFLEFFFAECFSEPHSTKQIEDAVGWGLETDAETLIASQVGAGLGSREDLAAVCARVRCPVLVLHGDEDRIRPHAHGAELAELTGGRLVTLEGSGHLPHARDPVKVNLLIRDFVESPA